MRVSTLDGDDAFIIPEPYTPNQLNVAKQEEANKKEAV